MSNSTFRRGGGVTLHLQDIGHGDVVMVIADDDVMVVTTQLTVVFLACVGQCEVRS